VFKSYLGIRKYIPEPSFWKKKKKKNCIPQRIKGMPGITDWWLPGALIDGVVWHLNVDSSHLGVEEGPKGSVVRRFKWYVNWV